MNGSIDVPLFADYGHSMHNFPSLLLSAFPSQWTDNPLKPWTKTNLPLLEMTSSGSLPQQYSGSQIYRSRSKEVTSGKTLLLSSDILKARTLLTTHLDKVEHLVKSRAWINTKTLRLFSNHHAQLPIEISSTSHLIITEFSWGLFWTFPSP